MKKRPRCLGEKGKLYPKRMVTVVVKDDLVDDVVEAIINTNQTGKPGDGKILSCRWPTPSGSAPARRARSP